MEIGGREEFGGKGLGAVGRENPLLFTSHSPLLSSAPCCHYHACCLPAIPSLPFLPCPNSLLHEKWRRTGMAHCICALPAWQQLAASGRKRQAGSCRRACPTHLPGLPPSTFSSLCLMPGGGRTCSGQNRRSCGNRTSGSLGLLVGGGFFHTPSSHSPIVSVLPSNLNSHAYPRPFCHPALTYLPHPHPHLTLTPPPALACLPPYPPATCLHTHMPPQTFCPLPSHFLL